MLGTKIPLKRRNKESGFTLVELAIVLVIIGLIIGGVLVGQDLIKAAEVRATISQIESYNAAVNTFRGRYNGLPGDIRNIDSFFDTATWTNMLNGDGDRMLESCVAIAATGLCDVSGAAPYYEDIETQAAAPDNIGEILQFWHHLSAAELVAGFYDGVAYGGSGGTATSGTVDTSFPRVKMDRNGIGVYGADGRNFYQIGVTDNATDEGYTTAASLTPEEAYNLDSKVDDGRPNSGGVLARGDTIPNQPLSAANDEDDFGTNADTACQTEAEGAGGPGTPLTATYALLNTNLACQLRFRMN